MLTDAEAQSLIQERKLFVNDETVRLSPGVKEARDIVSADGSDAFVLDYWRGSIKLSRAKYQNRTRTTIVLVRLDIDGPPHTNPDGELIGGTHVHMYREGYEAKWAQEIENGTFTDPSDLVLTFQEFCAFCSIGSLPPIEDSLFS